MPASNLFLLTQLNATSKFESQSNHLPLSSNVPSLKSWKKRGKKEWKNEQSRAEQSRDDQFSDIQDIERYERIERRGRGNEKFLQQLSTIKFQFWFLWIKDRSVCGCFQNLLRKARGRGRGCPDRQRHTHRLRYSPRRLQTPARRPNKCSARSPASLSLKTAENQSN